MTKQSSVMRVPKELIERINVYERTLANSGIRMARADVIRNFANEAITPRDNVITAIGRLNEASKKKL